MSDLKTVTFDASQYQLVPKVPTLEMKTAGDAGYCKTAKEGHTPHPLNRAKNAWAAMLAAAAPTPAAQSAGQEPVAHIVTRKDDGQRFLVFADKMVSWRKYPDDFGVTDLYDAPVNGGERELGQVIDERDQYHDAAEKLADAIAKHFGVEIGEHSNLNCPWQNAFDHIAQATKRVADAPQVGGDEREAFEHAERTSNLQRDDEGDYVNPCVQSSWEGWQARAVLSADGGEDKREIPDLPPPPDNVLADMQVTVDRLKMWAKGEAHYAPANGYDDPGVKKATISDVKKSAGYFAKRLEESYFSLRDFLFAMDQIRAAIAANQARKGE